MPEFYRDLVKVFVITALWDVVLRMFAMKHVEFMGIENWNWVATLKPYFEHHTLLGAALIAGFAGAAAFTVIKSIDASKFSNMQYVLWVCLVSAFIGVPMRYSGLFPKLKKYYYDPLPYVTVFSDALSGVVVLITYYILHSL